MRSDFVFVPFDVETFGWMCFPIIDGKLQIFRDFAKTTNERGARTSKSMYQVWLIHNRWFYIYITETCKHKNVRTNKKVIDDAQMKTRLYEKL